MDQYLACRLKNCGREGGESWIQQSLGPKLELNSLPEECFFILLLIEVFWLFQACLSTDSN